VKQNLMRRLQQTIAELLPNGNPSLQFAANVSGTSSRTLQRHLAKLNLSYSRLVDEVRYNKACNMLKTRKYKINEISTNLGYADAGSFTRAFIRWYGSSPQSYRKAYRQATIQ